MSLPSSGNYSPISLLASLIGRKARLRQVLEYVEEDESVTCVPCRSRSRMQDIAHSSLALATTQPRYSHNIAYPTHTEAMLCHLFSVQLLWISDVSFLVVILCCCLTFYFIYSCFSVPCKKRDRNFVFLFAILHWGILPRKRLDSTLAHRQKNRVAGNG